MKTRINARELATLLKIPVSDAKKKMLVMSERNTGNNQLEFPEGAEELAPNHASIKEMGEHLGVDLDFYIKDIQENYLKRPTTRGYIFNYPLDKIDSEKPDKTIRIPVSIRTLLTGAQKKQIIAEWESRFPGDAIFKE